MMAARSQKAADKGQSIARRLRQRLNRAERSTVVSVVVVAYVFAAAATWALITPIGGAVDEPAHITYAAGVVRGDFGTSEVVNHPNYPVLQVVSVPQWVASITDPPRSVETFSFPCFGGADELTADCALAMSNSKEIVGVPTTVTRYPPPYHWLVGLPTLVMTGAPAVYAMRIVAAALAATMIGLGLAASSPSRRVWLGLGAVVAFTPMAGHLAGSVNPSGFEIAAATGLGIALMGIVGSECRRPGLTAILITTLSWALAWSRPRMYLALFAVLAAAVLINMNELREWFRNRIVRFAVSVGMVGAGVTSYVFERLFTQTEAITGTPTGIIEGSLGQAPSGVIGNLHALEDRFVHWGSDLFGRFGWLDHSPPRSVLIYWGGLVLALLLLAIAHGQRRDGVALMTIGVGALVLAPLLAITKSLNVANYQARYHLSAAVLIIIGTTAILGRLDKGRGQHSAWTVLRNGALLTPIAMLVSISASLHRYSVGGEAQLADVALLPLKTFAWLPPPEALLLAGLAAALLVSAAIVVRKNTTVQPPSPSDDEVGFLRIGLPIP